MGFKYNSVVRFNANTDVGLDRVALGSIIQVNDGGVEKMLHYKDNTGVTNATTIADAITGANLIPMINNQDATNIIQVSSPVGNVQVFAASSIPSGYLECNGSALSRTAYAALFAIIGTTYGVGDGSTTFNIPDLRGEFIRGYDNGRGIDTGRGIGTWQADDFKSHSHLYGRALGGSGIDSFTSGSFTTASVQTGLTGGNETRPRNIAMMYCIKY